MRDQFFKILSWLALKKTKWVLIAAMGVFLLGLALSSLLKPKMTWMDLLPQDEPKVQEFNQILKDFGASELIMVSIEGPDVQTLIRFAQSFEKKAYEIKDAQGHALVRKVQYQEDPEFFRKHGLYMMKPKDLQHLVKAGFYQGASLQNWIQAENRTFKQEYLSGGEEKSLEQQENEIIRAIQTMRQVPKALQWYFAHLGESDQSLQAGLKPFAQRFVLGDLRYLSDDEKILLIMVYPTYPSSDADRAVALTGQLRALFEKELENYPEIAKHYAGPWKAKSFWGTTVPAIAPEDQLDSGTGMTGMHVYMNDETMTIIHDMGWANVIAFVLVLVLFVLAFRMLSAPLLAMAVLVMSIVVSLGWVAIVLGELTMMAMMFPVILMGLGVDYAIHLIGEFTQRRQQGLSIEEAMSSSLEATGKGILTGALTTSVAFLSLAFTSFRGLSDLGISAGLGVLSTLLSSFLVLPAALVLIQRWGEKRKGKRTLDAFHLEFTLIKVTGGWAYRHWLWIIGGVFLLTLLLFPRVTQVLWSKNMLDIEAKHLAALELNKVLEKRFYMHPDHLVLSVDSIEESHAKAEAFKEQPTVRQVHEISMVIPPEIQQHQTSKWVEEIQNQVQAWPQPQSLTQESLPLFLKALYQMDCNFIMIRQMAFMGGMDRLYRFAEARISNAQKCFVKIKGQPRPKGGWPRVAASPELKEIEALYAKNPELFLKNMQRFQKLFEPLVRQEIRAVSQAEPIALKDLPESIRVRYVSKDGKRFLMRIYPKGDIWSFEFQKKFFKDVDKVSDRTTGTVVLFAKTIERGAIEGGKATLYAFLAIVFILFLDFWGFRRSRIALRDALISTVLAMIPLTLGALWMGASFSLLNIRLNMVNVITIPLLLGIGIDDGVHMIHRYRHEGTGSIEKILATTGRSVFLTSVTTIAAFGSLMFSLYQGFVGTGLILSIGIGICLLLSIYLLPALIHLIEFLGITLHTEEHS